MSRDSIQRRPLDADARELLNVAVESLETICGAILVASVFVDESGTFVHMRPGREQQVARLLATVDWKNARMIVDEHLCS